MATHRFRQRQPFLPPGLRFRILRLIRIHHRQRRILTQILTQIQAQTQILHLRLHCRLHLLHRLLHQTQTRHQGTRSSLLSRVPVRRGAQRLRALCLGKNPSAYLSERELGDVPCRMEPLLDPHALPPDHRSGYVAIIGAPNVGKSTLMNHILGRKLSIVTERPSTTRNRVLGIYSDEVNQIVFLDTPGVVRPRYLLHEKMMHDVDRSVADADILLFMVDATEPAPTHDARGALDRIDRSTKPALLVLNKMDLILPEKALPLVEQYAGVRAFEEVVPVSAKTGKGMDVLMEQVKQRLPLGPPYYPKDQLSEHPERFFIAEIVREAIFNRFREEIPYSTQVMVVTYETRQAGKDFIDCEIVVERDAQKGILIGKGGKALKNLGAAARKGIEEFLGKPVYLQLHVKTRSGWRNKEGMLRNYGFGR